MNGIGLRSSHDGEVREVRIIGTPEGFTLVFETRGAGEVAPLVTKVEMGDEMFALLLQLLTLGPDLHTLLGLGDDETLH